MSATNSSRSFLRHEIQAGKAAAKGRICGPPCLGHDKSDKIINRRACPKLSRFGSTSVELLATCAQVAHHMALNACGGASSKPLPVQGSSQSSACSSKLLPVFGQPRAPSRSAQSAPSTTSQRLSPRSTLALGRKARTCRIARFPASESSPSGILSHDNPEYDRLSWNGCFNTKNGKPHNRQFGAERLWQTTLFALMCEATMKNLHRVSELPPAFVRCGCLLGARPHLTPEARMTDYGHAFVNGRNFHIDSWATARCSLKSAGRCIALRIATALGRRG